MKKKKFNFSIITMIIIIMFSSSLTAQSEDNKVNLLIDELIKELDQRSEAIVNKDLKYFQNILDNKFVYINASGRKLNKEEYIRMYISSTQFVWKKQKLNNVNTTIHDNIAIVNCEINDVFIFDEKEYDARFLSTQIFIRRNGSWRYLAGHTSNLGN